MLERCCRDNSFLERLFEITCTVEPRLKKGELPHLLSPILISAFRVSFNNGTQTPFSSFLASKANKKQIYNLYRMYNVTV